jgi:hypothetical protein
LDGNDVIIVIRNRLVYQSVRTIAKLIDSPGNFELQIWRILAVVLFPMVLDGNDVIIVIRNRLVYQSVRTIASRSAWRSLFRFVRGIDSEHGHAKRARRTIWFTRQISSTTMKESRRRVISHALGWGRRHYCYSEPPCVSIRSNDCIANIISSNTQGGRFQYLVRRPAITFPILKGAKKQTSTCFNRSGRCCSLEYWKNVPWRCTATRKLEIQVILVDSIRPKIWCFPHQMR